MQKSFSLQEPRGVAPPRAYLVLRTAAEVPKNTFLVWNESLEIIKMHQGKRFLSAEIK
jgi:hypothetical protein